MSQVTLTRHGEKRIRERAGLSKKACERMAKIAFMEGAAIEDTKGRLRNYMLQHYTSHDGATDNMRVYGDKIWIFNGTCLITILQIPTGISSKGTARYVNHHTPEPNGSPCG